MSNWKLVPVEPTPEMVEAAVSYRPMPIEARIRGVWQDMIAAAPAPATSGGQEVTDLVRVAAWNAAKSEGCSDETGYRVVEAVVAAASALARAGGDGWRIDAGWRRQLRAVFSRPGVLDAMERGLRTGGFPMVNGEMVSWSDWLIFRMEIEPESATPDAEGR